MKPGTAQSLRIAALLVFGAGYAVGAHWFTTRPGHAEYGAILSIAPWLAIGLALTWQSKRRGLLIAGCIGVLLALYVERQALLENYTWVYFIQHAGSFFALAVSFGRTLVGEREPMCTRFARAVHGKLADEVLRYTRQITLAWTTFFAALCVVSIGLFALAPLSVWSVFANLLTPILIGLMFVVEYLIRLRVLPKLEHQGVLEAVRSIWAASSAASSESR